MSFILEGNPLEEKSTAEGNWRDDVAKKLIKLKVLDGNCQPIAIELKQIALRLGKILHFNIDQNFVFFTIKFVRLNKNESN